MEQGDPWVKVATTHLIEKMPSNPKKKRPNCSSLEEGNNNGGRGSERQ